jgi:hypothetical protein
MPPSPSPSPPAASRAGAAMLQSVRSLASYSDTLADFLDQWNSVILDVASIAATFAVLFPGPESHPNKLPLPAPADPAPESAPSLAPEPQGPEPNAVPTPPERQPTPSPEPSPSPEQQQPPEQQQQERQPKPAREPEPEPVPAPAPRPAPNPPSSAELELRCKQMNSRELRRFVTAHVRDREWLRQVGPPALRRAVDPASLVLRAVGRYYISAVGGDAEAACMLLLELYVRAGCPRPPEAPELRQEAREAALTWRSRLLRASGRFGDAGARGARGLAFFMAAFGVPAEFPPQELYELLVAADISACAKVLRCSKHFVKKMRGEQGIYFVFR